MSISIISDIHIKNKNDIYYKFLLNFLKHPKVKNSEYIIFLGDIFDLMVGNHEEYIDKYDDFFNIIIEYSNKGTKIIYLEGNHDFHLEGMTASYAKEIKFLNRPFVLNLWGKKYLFCHGDEFNVGDYFYKFYKSIMGLHLIKGLANVVSYKFIENIGHKASNKSRSRHLKRDYDFTLIRSKYRDGAIEMAKKYKSDYILAGHSHVKDDFLYEKDGDKIRYLNNGYALESKSFIYMEQNEAEFIYL